MYLVSTGIISRKFNNRNEALVHFYSIVMQDPALDASFKTKITKLKEKLKYDQIVYEYNKYIETKNIKRIVSFQESTYSDFKSRAKYIFKGMFAI